MKVIVTKDSFGVSVWGADAVLTFEHLLSFRGRKAGVPVWSDTRSLFRPSRRLFNSRQVRRMMPEIGDDLGEGQEKACVLTISQANDIKISQAND